MNLAVRYHKHEAGVEVAQEVIAVYRDVPRDMIPPSGEAILIEDTAYIIAGQLWDLKGHNVTLEVE
ncbi:hypothetical protein SEA_BISKIT_63 [Gordonia phage Biskit]|uniref:Uncharacterized protein n=4 Tax=Emalynvirus troje TaxID=2560511 RepID=A0A2K9VEQ5_9CAUD|nr:hypothetical protein FDJ27_gp63 [Gordonia phage Troje]AXH45161.1 hypothetical protein SEA_SKETCHMEX_61 [Gordonia phage SketchMex]QNJ59493.1 hypothetical protein SEA_BUTTRMLKDREAMS_63 [Gordonia phage Buttrmlkdreams]QWY84936.1 hypothetical protein SEA_MSCARN_65 [Gordonia phage MScarn]UVK62102.1 hypothetical protein SEA_BISKIT_63 [Gordonia phage Biskit]AUV60768.1 hypothetical protein SEA_TROJE_63 [Gordonia phage Troje]